MSDLFKETILPQDSSLPFNLKEWASVLDNQGQNYPGGVVNLDLTPFSQSAELFASFNEAILSIPLVLVVSSDPAVNGGAGFTADLANSYCASLKNNHNLIHSMNITVGGTTYSQACNFSNIPVSFKLSTSMNSNDLINLGPSIGFVKNTGYFKYNGGYTNDTTHTTNGIGENNNNIQPQPDTPQGGYSNSTFNGGRFLRCSQMAYDVLSTTNNSMLAQLKSQAQAQQEQTNYFQAAANGSEVVYYILATIRMKDISSLFANLPLCRGCRIGLQITTNAQSSFTFKTTAGLVGVAGSNLVLAANSLTGADVPRVVRALQAQAIDHTGLSWDGMRGTCPFMISGPQPMTTQTNNTGFNSVPFANTYIISLGIAKSYKSVLAGGYFHAQPCVKMWIPQYRLTPPYASYLLEKMPTKRVVYTDIMQQTFIDQTVNTPMTNIFPGQPVNPKWILIIPFFGCFCKWNIIPCANWWKCCYCWYCCSKSIFTINFAFFIGG